MTDGFGVSRDRGGTTMATVSDVHTAKSPTTVFWRSQSGIRLRRTGSLVLTHLVLILLSTAFILPFLWMVGTSLKTNDQVLAWPPQWIPNPLNWHNYPDAL